MFCPFCVHLCIFKAECVHTSGTHFFYSRHGKNEEWLDLTLSHKKARSAFLATQYSSGLHSLLSIVLVLHSCADVNINTSEFSILSAV